MLQVITVYGCSYESQQNSSGALMFWWSNHVIHMMLRWRSCRCWEKGGKDGEWGEVLLLLPFVWVNTFCFHFPNVDIWCSTFDPGCKIRLWAGRAGLSSVWQMIQFRCDYWCIVWGWGCDSVINVHMIKLHYFTTAGVEADGIQLLVGDMLNCSGRVADKDERAKRPRMLWESLTSEEGDFLERGNCGEKVKEKNALAVSWWGEKGMLC